MNGITSNNCKSQSYSMYSPMTTSQLCLRKHKYCRHPEITLPVNSDIQLRSRRMRTTLAGWKKVWQQTRPGHVLQQTHMADQYVDMRVFRLVSLSSNRMTKLIGEWIYKSGLHHRQWHKLLTRRQRNPECDCHWHSQNVYKRTALFYTMAVILRSPENFNLCDISHESLHNLMK